MAERACHVVTSTAQVGLIQALCIIDQGRGLKKLKALGVWLAAPRYVWLCAIIIAVALFCCLQPHTSERVIRLTGLILQILGIGTVIWGVSATRALFDRPPVMETISDWIKSFPLRKRHAIAGVGSATMAVSASGRGHGTYNAGPNPTIGDRLDALEKNIAAIHSRITNLQAESDESFRDISERLALEQHNRQSDTSAIRAKLEATSTGGLHISAMGAAWLFVGVVLSTAAIEIACYLA